MTEYMFVAFMNISNTDALGSVTSVKSVKGGDEIRSLI